MHASACYLFMNKPGLACWKMRDHMEENSFNLFQSKPLQTSQLRSDVRKSVLTCLGCAILIGIIYAET